MPLLLRLFCTSALAATVGATVPAVQNGQSSTPSPVAQDTVAAMRSPETFAQLPGLVDPQISPDGKQFAARIAIGSKLYLATMPIDGGKPRLIDAGPAQINWWHWVNDEWLVMGVGQRIPIHGDYWYVSRAYGVGAN